MWSSSIRVMLLVEPSRLSISKLSVGPSAAPGVYNLKFIFCLCLGPVNSSHLLVGWEFLVSRGFPSVSSFDKDLEEDKTRSEALELQLCEEQTDNLRLSFDKLITRL